jgi:hypothetical protein
MSENDFSHEQRQCFQVAWIKQPPKHIQGNRSYASLSNAVRAVIRCWDGDEVAVLAHPTVPHRWNLQIRGKRVAVVSDMTPEADRLMGAAQ